MELKAASLNFRDLKILKGRYARPPDLPVTLLSDGAGEIIDTGLDVGKFSIGDRAMPIYMHGWHDGPLADRHAGWKALGGDVDGVASEFAIFHEDDVLPIPDCLSYEQAACIPCAGVTAWHALV
jgi:NADPH:quinone reductase-like Zn-dependent oxidoreductase